MRRYAGLRTERCSVNGYFKSYFWSVLMIGAVFTVAILLADATPAAAQPTPAAPAAAPADQSASAKPKVNRDGMVCHTEEILGSRIPKRVCMTPADAEARAHQDQQNLGRIQSQFGYNHQ
jgi:hypothetical protein